MTTITFDTLELVDKLKNAGIPQEQAEAVVRVIADAQETLVSNVTLDHRLKETELLSDARFERIDGELKLNRWMLGILIAGVMSLVLKTFFT
jgi:hypothetical protein